MLQALAARERELSAIAESYMLDPAFAQCRADEALWDTTVGDSLENPIVDKSRVGKYVGEISAKDLLLVESSVRQICGL